MEYAEPLENSPLSKQALEAIRHIGRDAVPYLLEWIQYEPPAWRDKLAERISNTLHGSGRLWCWINSKAARTDGAVKAFEALQSQAAQAIPSLTKIIESPKVSFWCKIRAIKALGNLGKDAAVPLVTYVRNRQAEVELRRVAAGVLVGMGTNARPAIPGLIMTLDDSEYYIAFDAAEALCKSMRLEPTLIIPTLRGRLEDPHPQMRIFIANWLGSYGAEARAAVPALTGLLDDKNAEVRKAAANALERIAPKALDEVSKK